MDLKKLGSLNKKLAVSGLRNLLRFYKDLSIKRKLLLILNLQIMIPLILVSYLSFKSSEEIIKNKSMDYSQDILGMIELRLKDYVNNLTVISQDLLYDKKIYSILGNDSGNNDLLKNYEDDNEINNIFRKVILSRKEVQSICIISNGQKNIYFSDNTSRKINIKEVINYEDMLVKAREGEGKAVWYLDVNERRAGNVFLLRTIYDQNTFRETGLLVILINKEFLETVYQDLMNEDMQDIAIFTADNDLIVSRNPENTYLFDKDLQAIASGDKGWTIDEAGGALIAYVSMQEPDWRVVSYVSLDRLYKEIDKLRQRILLIGLSCIIILSVLSILISIDFINPINRLVKGMNTVQGGHNSVRIDVDRGDELGYLSRTFNDMAEEINHLVTWKYSEEITRKEAELKALQSQINPHFLFNTLESINWMAQLNNVPEISNTVTALSSIMEAGIGRDDRLITVREEFCYIDNYIMILKNRYEDRIELYKDVREEALAIMIPRLLIQPLVENAVYHGIEKIRGKGVIWLKALTDGQDMKIIVEDNGPGIEQGELDIINERLAVDNETYFKNLQTRKNKSIGLDNVNRRIKLFYGEEYGLKIESRQSSEYWLGVERRRTGDTSAVVTEQPDERRQASYTRVVVTIPLRQDGKSGMGTEAAEV